MQSRGLSRRRTLLPALLAGLALVPVAAAADPIPSHAFATPIFGLATAPDGSLLVADYGTGIVELRKGEDRLIAELPAVSDVAPLGRGSLFALTGAGDADTAGKLFRVSQGQTRQLADLVEFETEVNPARSEPS